MGLEKDASFLKGFFLSFFERFFPNSGVPSSHGMLVKLCFGVFLELPMQPSAGIERVDRAECW